MNLSDAGVFVRLCPVVARVARQSRDKRLRASHGEYTMPRNTSFNGSEKRNIREAAAG